VYTVRIQYPDDWGIHTQDATTHSISVDLYVKHGIDTAQNTHNTLVLHSSADLTLALLAIPKPPLYDAVIASKTPIL